MQLSMMLVISRSEALPDRRHRLYERLFCHLLARRERADRDEWRPDDEKERQKAVAMQDQRTSHDKTKGIVYKPAELAKLIPAAVQKKDDWLRWLANQSGLLRDRADGTLQFAHLSYQDFAAARHLLFEMSPADG